MSQRMYLSSLVSNYYYNWSYEEIFNLVDYQQQVLLGVGRTTPWLIDGWAEPVFPFMKEQRECLGWVRTTSIPVIEVTVVGEGEPPSSLIKVGAKYYQPVALTLEAITAASCNTVLFRAKLNHQQLLQTTAVDKYRSVALYFNPQYSLGNAQLNFKEDFIPVALATAELFYLRHCERPRGVNSKVVEDFIEVVTFTTG